MFSPLGQFGASGNQSRSSSREVGIRVPTFSAYFAIGEPSPKTRGEKGHLAAGPSPLDKRASPIFLFQKGSPPKNIYKKRPQGSPELKGS